MDGRPNLTPLNNWMFLSIFGGAGSEGVSMSFANAILRGVGLEPLESVDAINADSSMPGRVDVKAPRADVLLMCGDRAVDIEAERRDVNFENKALFYAARSLSSRVPKGGDTDYEGIPQTVVIMLIRGHEAFEGDQAVTVVRMHAERGGDYLRGNDRIVLVLCEVDKVARRYNAGSPEVAGDPMTAWLYTLAKGYESAEEAGGIMEKVPGIAEFFERYDLAIGDPAAWEAYDREVFRIMDDNDVETRSRKRGLEEGRAQGRAETIEQLRTLGVADDIIAQLEATA